MLEELEVFTRPPIIEVRRLEEFDVKEHDATIITRPVRVKELASLGLSSLLESHIKRNVQDVVVHVVKERDVIIAPKLEAPSPSLLVRYSSAQCVRKAKSFYRNTAVLVTSTVNNALYNTVLGTLLGCYEFAPFKSKEHSTLEKITVYYNGKIGNAETQLKRALVIAKAVYIARDIANAPPNIMNPDGIERMATKLAGKIETLSVRVIRGEELEKEGLNGIFSVGKGSLCEPRLIIVEYNGDTSSSGEKIAIVGKTVTFDAGGLDLKSSEGMDEMKYDKSGGASALATILALAALKIKKNLVALLPAVENLPSHNPYKPRDVIRMFNGKTIEVTNTDAEGRITLADALSYAAIKLRATRLIDIATLTDAVVSAFGNTMAAIAGTDGKIVKILKRIEPVTGERYWEIPLHPEYKTYLESDVADLANSGGKEGSLCTSTWFLKEFTEGKPWTHIDIAGVAWTQRKGPKQPVYNKGATGWGVESLVHVIESLST